MKRLFVLLGVVAAMSAIVVTSAMAAPAVPSTTICTGSMDDAKIEGNLKVPAGAVFGIWGTVKGNAEVEGVLKSYGTTFEKNVTVNGGAFKALNWGTTIKGNLTINNSAGDTNPNDTNANGFFSVYSPSHIYGNFNYNGNSAPLVGTHESDTTVDKNFNFSNNTSWQDTAPMQVNGQTNIS
jgi:hypothetical protein